MQLVYELNGVNLRSQFCGLEASWDWPEK